MPRLTDETPFLADNEHDGLENHPIMVASANSHFKRPLNIITAVLSVLSIAVFALLIVTYVLLQTGPFRSIWSSQDSVRDLAIVLFVNFIVATPTVFLSVPILLNIASQIAMSVVVLVFSSNIFGAGWPDIYTCQQWQRGPNYGMSPAKPDCIRAKSVVMITMGVSGGVGFLIGILLLTTLLLRVVALARTKFWKDYKNKVVMPGWNPSGFTVQFTLSVLPNETRRKAAAAVAPGDEAEEARLIET